MSSGTGAAGDAAAGILGSGRLMGVGLTGVTSLAVTSGRSSAVGTGTESRRAGGLPPLITSSSGEVMVPVKASRRLTSSRMNAAFRGKITALEGRFPDSGPPDLVVLAEDALQGARMQRRTKNWDSTTLTAIAQQVATNLGLTPVLAGLDTNIGTQQQFNESDLHFLRRLLARYDADVQIVGTELHASPRSQAQRNSIEIDLNSQLKEVRVIADLSHQVTQMTATGWDYTQGQRISVTSQTTSFGPGSGQSGKSMAAAGAEHALGAAWAIHGPHILRGAGAGGLPSSPSARAPLLWLTEFPKATPTCAWARICNSTDSARASRIPTTPLRPCITSIRRAAIETRFRAECAYLGGGS